MPPGAASPFWLPAVFGASVGLFAAPDCAASFSGLLALEAASCLGSDEAGRLAGFEGGEATAGPLGASGPLAVELGLNTAPWWLRTLEDRLPVAGGDVGVSLRSTRGATLGAEAGGGEEAVAALEGVLWLGGPAVALGTGVSGSVMLEVSVVVSLVGLFWAVAKVSVMVSEFVVTVVTDGIMSSVAATVSAGCL